MNESKRNRQWIVTYYNVDTQLQPVGHKRKTITNNLIGFVQKNTRSIRMVSAVSMPLAPLAKKH